MCAYVLAAVRTQCCDGDRCNDPASQVKQCLVSSADGSSSSVASCSAATDKCVTATSSALSMPLYSCSSESTDLFGFDCADSPGTGRYLSALSRITVAVECCDEDLCNRPRLPECYVSDPGTVLEAGERFCDTVLNDGGRVMQQERDGGFIMLDDGQAWGICSSKPRLPSFGMDYDPATFEQMTSLSAFQIFTEYQSCGRFPLIVRRNRAHRYGGGVFQNGCDSGIRTRTSSGAQMTGTCWIGGLSAETTSALMIVFEDNEADGAGGAIYSKCHDLGPCGTLASKRVGIPVEGADILSFRGSNYAAGYGNTIASAPHELVITEASATEYVPGQSVLDVTFLMLDARGQKVVGSPLKASAKISHAIQVKYVSAK